MKKQLFWTFAGLSSFTVSLAALAPLPVVAHQLSQWNPGLEFAGVSGSLWNGEVQRLKTPQAVVNDLNWTFVPQKLLSGVLAADMQAEVRTVQLQGQCGITLTQKLHCAPLRAEMEAKNMGQLIPDGQRMPVQLEGNLLANLDDLSWDRVHVPVMNGRLLWDDGRVQAPIKLALGGRYQANLSGSEGEPLAIELLSQETQVVLDGEVSVQPEGMYELEVFVKPAGDADPAIGAALEMAGAPQNDGSVRIQREGKLPLPASTDSAAATQ